MRIALTATIILLFSSISACSGGMVEPDISISDQWVRAAGMMDMAEYSGMNDPLWDLGDLSVEGVFNDAQDMEMMEAYFGRKPTAAEHGRVVIYKAMCDLLWTLWGLIQLANKNPADDFRAYADGRFARCKALMADPAFAAHVEAVRRG